MWNHYKTLISYYLPIAFTVIMVVLSAFCWSQVLRSSQGEQLRINEVTEVTTTPTGKEGSKEGKEVMVLIGFFVVLSQYLSSK